MFLWTEVPNKVIVYFRGKVLLRKIIRTENIGVIYLR
jgi:hypothetical protein